VVGGGIAGLSHAAAASARGLRVVLLERGAFCADASARNFGLLTQLYDDGGASGRRAARGRELYAGWARAGALPMRATPSLQLAQSPAQQRLLRAFATAATARGLRCELLSAAEARREAPALARARAGAGAGTGSIAGALRIEGDALIEPRVLVATLPAFLARAPRRVAEGAGGAGGAAPLPVALRCRESVVAIEAAGASEGAGVRLTTSRGESVAAARAVLCAGGDVVSLLPGVFARHAAQLRLCKLQMTRVRLPPAREAAAAGGAGGAPRAALPLPVTSGLTLRRYPAFPAFAPAAFADMMREEAGDAAAERAERLGIHVIARPAARLPRTAFGDLMLDGLGGLGGLAGGAGEVPLDDSEIVLGDSHQYAALAPPAAAGSAGAAQPHQFDEACDEGVTDEILRVAGTMLRGVEALRAQRAGERAGTGARGAAARLLSQWSGVYLQHSAGALNLTLDAREHVEDGAGRLHVVTGFGGAGMTMAPGLAEENVARWFG